VAILSIELAQTALQTCLKSLPASHSPCAKVSRTDAEAVQAVAMIPGDDEGGAEVDELKLPAPQTLHGGRERLQTLEQEVALKGEMAHFIPQELPGDGLHHWIAATQRKQAEIDLCDEFGGGKDLNVEPGLCSRIGKRRRTSLDLLEDGVHPWALLAW
jgi:hypothetical protein